jgi:hypothetical protein
VPTSKDAEFPRQRELVYAVLADGLDHRLTEICDRVPLRKEAILLVLRRAVASEDVWHVRGGPYTLSSGYRLTAGAGFSLVISKGDTAVANSLGERGSIAVHPPPR